MRNKHSYDKYTIKDGKVTLTEFGYCQGKSSTDNPLEVCRIVTLESMPYDKETKDGYEKAVRKAKQVIASCIPSKYLRHIEELKEGATIRSIYDTTDAPDGNYLSL